MRAESTERPASPFEIEVEGEKATVMFYQNIKKVKTDDGEKYEYDFYSTEAQYTPDLEKTVEEHCDEWIAELQAREREELQAKYIDRVEMLIRSRYSINDELAIQRQKETKVDEWNEYNAFVEKCKVEAKRAIF